MTAIDKPHLDRAHVLDLLAHMIRVRKFEDKCAELYTQEKIRGFLHLYDGEEAIAAGVIPVLRDTDRIVATYREHGHALARGMSMDSISHSPGVRYPYPKTNTTTSVPLFRTSIQPWLSNAPVLRRLVMPSQSPMGS